MGDIMITLDKIDLNKKVKVISISDDHLLKRRLLDIGNARHHIPHQAG